MNLEQQNILIELFMATFEKFESDRLRIIDDLSVKCHSPRKFNESWDLLMPVVEKIIEMEEDEGRFFNCFCDEIAAQSGIDGVYGEVVTFIEQYNQNR